MAYRFRTTAALTMVLASAGCSSGDKAGTHRGYQVTIRQTSYGIPHVIADDLPAAGAGLGYVAARDYGCILLDQIVRVRGERSKYFGRGTNDANVNSDFAMLTLDIRAVAEEGLAAQSEELRATIDGYVAGFNHYLSHEPLAAECDGAEWVRPLTAPDLFAYYYWLAQLASADPLLGGIAAAAPPTTAQAAQPLAPQDFPNFADQGLGSNGWAIGRDKSETGRGMLIANPHFPWEGNRKFYENHITVPGKVNAYGASLLGAPVINIGFNEDVAWTHTVTTAHHFTLYRLDLVPGNPLRYLYDGQPRPIEGREFSIEVLGSSSPETRTMYRSHYGPMVAISALTWDGTTAYSMRNANEKNFAIGEQWKRMNVAKTLADLKAANEDVHGIPWVNTMAVDAAGNALFMDASRTPNLTDAALADHVAALAADPLVQIVDSQGATLLNGSDSRNEWVNDAGEPTPGIVAFSRSPQLERTDFVANANDSHWLTNPAAPLEGYSVLFGKERTQRSPRTRMNLTMLTEQAAAGATGADGKFSYDELSKVEFNDRAYRVEILLDQVLARCTGAGTLTVDATPVDIGAACTVLAAWDRTLRLDSAGAPLFREFLAAGGGAFGDAFDPGSPVATPSQLVPVPATGDDPVLVALGKGVLALAAAGLPPATTLRDTQHAVKGTEIIPIHGGNNTEGAFNIVGYGADNGTLLPGTTRGTTLSPSGLTADGYLINSGSSFMMALEFTPTGPHAQAVLSYSESSDPASPHFADQTRLFSQSQYRPVLFTEAEIAADPNLTVIELDVP